MKKKSLLLYGLLCALGLSSLSASALDYKQVGTPNLTDVYNNKSSNLPVYTMDKYCEGINFYQKDAIGLDAGMTIKEISFIGYGTLDIDFSNATISVYLANTTSTDYKDFVVAGDPEGSKAIATTIFDKEKATLFYEGAFQPEIGGAFKDPIQVFKIEGEGFNYEGENLMVYMYLSCPGGGPYTTFYNATASGTTFRSYGAYRYSPYTPEQYNGGYSVYTKAWNTISDTKIQVPVMTIGYEAGAMNEKQIGELTTNTTCNLPVYDMSKYGQGITFYKKDALGLDAGTNIKQIGFMGYQSSAKDFTGAWAKVYVANTTLGNGTNDYKQFLKDGEPEKNTATTIIDPEKATLFYDGPLANIEVQGSITDPVEIMTFESADGFEYTGDNLMVFVEIGSPKASGIYTSFITAKQSGTTYKSNGAYRESGYDGVQYPGSGINTKSWSTASTLQVPVMILRYGGEAQKISATVTGRIYSGLNNNPLSGATVKLLADGEVMLTTESTSNGIYKFDVEAVDMKAVYTVSAELEGYEAATTKVDLKAGGEIKDVNITLPKLPVPAVLSGFVVNKETKALVAGASVSFNGSTLTTGEDGAYKFDIANVDVLPADGLALTATAKGYDDYSTSLRITGDMEFNIEIAPLPALPGEGVQVGEYTNTDYDHQAPVNTLWDYSVAEMIYPKAMLGGLTEGQKFSSLSFYGYMTPTQTTTPGTGDGDDDDDDYNYGYDDYDNYYGAPAKAEVEELVTNITVYMVDTDEEKFSTGSEGTDYSAYTKLYEGPVTIKAGGAKNAPQLMFTADFTTAYTYGGSNIKIIVVSATNRSRLTYYALDPSAKSNVLAKSCGKNEDINARAFSLVSKGLPVIKLGDYVPTAEVKGTVTDKNTQAPLEGAEVTLSYETEQYTATTDAEGLFTIAVRDVHVGTEYALSVSCGVYNEITEAVTFTDETLEQTVDFALTVDAEVSGKVIDAETTEAIEGAIVVLKGTDGEQIESTTTDAEGAYEFLIESAAYGEYTIEVSAEGYNELSSTVEISLEQLSVADVDFELATQTTGIANILGAAGTADVYTVSGVLVKKAAKASDLRTLPAGIYVIGDRKVNLKH